MSDSSAPDSSRITSPGEGTYVNRNDNDHNLFTESLASARNALFGSSSAGAPSSEARETVNDGFKNTSTWLSGATATRSSAEMVKPSGILSSEETSLSGKRYADRPEGIDQFGGEETERDNFISDSPSTGVTTSSRRYHDRPEGLDQFGGEESERDVHEIKEWETKSSHAINVQKWPMGVDQVGGLGENKE